MYNEPMFLISVVSKRLKIHPQTLRQYEREGLIEPGRSAGKVRMYSQSDIDRIRLILRFTRDLGVNLAGVGVILQLKKQLEIYEQMLRACGLSVGENSLLAMQSDGDGDAANGEGDAGEGGDAASGEGAGEGDAVVQKGNELMIWSDESEHI